MVADMWYLHAKLAEAEARGDIEEARRIREEIRRRAEEKRRLRREVEAEREAEARRLVEEAAKLAESGDYVNMTRKIAKAVRTYPEILDREEDWP
jgi:DNA repair photolyase